MRNLTLTLFRLLIAAVLGTTLTASLGAPSRQAVAERPGGTYKAWTQRQAILRHLPDVTRYYAFDGSLSESAPIADLAHRGDGGEALRFAMAAVAGAPPDRFQAVAGRWPEKQAIRLDQGYLVAKAPDFSNKAFSATLWFRPHGQGAHRGNDGTTNGMLLSSGNGYYEGWRVVRETSGRLSFVIGRPAPTGATGIGQSGDPLALDVWHHLAVTWDGRELRIYVDGDLAASGPYAGDYTPATNGEFRIGYADGGVGSEVMDVDEAALYRRALTPEEVLRDVYFYEKTSKRQLTLWMDANAAMLRNDNAGAEATLTTLLKMPDTGGDIAALTRLRRAGTLRRQGKSQAAFADLAAVADAPDGATRLSRQAQTNLVGLLRESAGASFPRRAYDRLLAQPDVSQADKRELRLSLGHALAASGDYPAACAEYVRLAADPQTPAAWRNVARLCLARAYTLAKNYAAAQTAYRQMREQPGALRYGAVEAEEGLQEIARLQAGKLAHDPLDSRTHLPTRPAPAVTFIVAPGGSDTQPGTQAAPFATLERARDAIRALRTNGALPKGGVTVVVRGGAYRVQQTFQLGAQDSGTASAPIVYRAAPGETPVFNAGTRIRGFAPVRDELILARLPEAARGHIVQTDLRAQGVTDLGTFTPGGFGSARGFRTHPLLWLYFNGTAMTLAQFPNPGQGDLKIADAAPDAKASFAYSDDRIARWKAEKDGWLYGYWFFNWADSYEKIGAIDTDRKTITLAPPVTTYGDGKTSFLKGQRFRGVNLLSEIDRPGEWVLERDTGLLYFYPPSDPAQADVEISLFEGRMAELENVSYVTLEGLTWQNGRGDGVLIRGGASCLLAGCTIRQFGGNGVEIDGGVGHGLLSCDIHTLGRGGTVISGGDRKTLTPGNHFIENCHIHHFSLVDHTYTPAVLLSGVGNRLTHNLFHDSYSSAMRVEGNDQRIEYNEVRNVLLESDDQGASDTWADETYRGLVFRYNYWHDMGNGLGVGQAGIRLDDFISGVVIYGNVFQRCADGNFGAVQMNQGADNLILNNVFVDCQAAVSGGTGSPERWKQYLADGMGKRFFAEVRADQPPYVTRYPELAHLGEDPMNRAWRNLALRCNDFDRVYIPQRLEAVDNVVAAATPA